MIKAVVLVIEDKGKVLFVRRSQHRKSLPGMWSLPSEKVVTGESLEEAVDRCARHELGIKITDYKLLDEYRHKDETEDKILYFFRCRIVEGNPTLEFTDEADQLVWLSISDFFNRFSDGEIGHGLRYLRTHSELWN